MKCDYCNAPLTPDEILHTAEAEDMSVEQFLASTYKGDLMCDKCAQGDGPYQ